MAKRITDLDVLELRQWFEAALSRAFNVDKTQKMRMRRRIRDEVFLLLVMEQPTPKGIMSRWEERLDDVFQALPYGLKEELFDILAKKLKKI
jgi:hypothetical protein